MPRAICILEGLVPFSVSPFERFNFICFSGLNSSEYFSSCFLGGALNYLRQQLQSTLLKTSRGWWTISLRSRCHQLPSLHTLPGWEGGKLSLFRPEKMPSFQAAMGSSEGVFFSSSPRTCISFLLENTTPGSSDKEKAAPDKRWGFALLSWCHFCVMKWKFWSFFCLVKLDNCFIFSTML